MRKIAALLIFLYSAAFGFYSQVADGGGLPGEYLNSFSVSARAFGMGKAFTGVANDVYAPYWNPAGIAFLNNSEAGFTLVSLAETRYSFVGCVIPLDLKTGIGISRFGFDSPLAEKTNSVGESLGYYQEKQSSYLISYAEKISDTFSYGLNLKVVFQEIDVYSAFGIGIDAGALISPVNNMRLGAVLQNILPASLKLKEETDRYPVNLKTGASYLFSDIDLLTTVDLSVIDILSFYKMTVRWGIGAEYHLKYWQDIYIRAGIDYKEAAFGAGISVLNVCFDYAVGISTFEVSHRASLTLKLGMPPSQQEKIIQEEKTALVKERAIIKLLSGSEQLFRDGNFTEAKKEVLKITEIDPANTEYKLFLSKVNKYIYGKEADDHYKNALKYMDEDNYDLADTEFKKTIELNPEHVEAKEYLHYNQARRNMSEKKYPEAEEELKTVLKINPANIKAKEALRRLLEVLDLLK
ncbi:MAG: hypothetical protein A2452_05870 [Candidatus Firestonebacteria bacterium RIFOXYC2_FULL_39_67]|nr:MAG: hypothetical protein A2536_11945 [Candidatus Firestonebacteria bacterium RIFOXYD2_FULL_39_29]OGF56601.1 MAG: hypothetical protein A2452_05870 [Candidatus Firestonebacteria bacterium RIFOXYC2_FULL_39_67]